MNENKIAIKDGKRGFVLIAALIVIFMLSILGYIGIQHTGMVLYMTAVEENNVLLEETAQACTDEIIHRIRAAGAGLLANPTADQYRGWLPNPSGESMTTITNPLVGSCVVMRANCSRGGVSPDCCCRTGPLYDGFGRFFNYNVGNPNHILVPSGAQMLTADGTSGSAPLGIILRFGNRVGHVIKTTGGTAGDDSYAFDRWLITITVAVNRSAREYQFALEEPKFTGP